MSDGVTQGAEKLTPTLLRHSSPRSSPDADFQASPNLPPLCVHGDRCLLLRINYERFVCAGLPPTQTAVRQARTLVSSALHAWGYICLVDDVVAVVSELVTNAYLHGQIGARIDMCCYAAGERLRFEVDDLAEAVPVPRRLNDLPECGRGLYLIDSLADGWGWQETLTGKTVWAEWLIRTEER